MSTWTEIDDLLKTAAEKQADAALAQSLENEGIWSEMKRMLREIAADLKHVNDVLGVRSQVAPSLTQDAAGVTLTVGNDSVGVALERAEFAIAVTRNGAPSGRFAYNRASRFWAFDSAQAVPQDVVYFVGGIVKAMVAGVKLKP